MEYVNCNSCGSADTKILYELWDYLLQRMEVQGTLVRCRQCGLIYQNPRPELNEISFDYPPEYAPYNCQLDKTNTSKLDDWLVQYGLNKRIHLIKKYKENGSLLDIGCGSGEFLNAMQIIPGWNLTGVELNSYAADKAIDRYNLRIFNGTLEQAFFPNETFDVVTLWDVLEHLHDPTASLIEIRRILKPGGLLVLRVPNYQSWQRRLFGRHWAGLDAPRHLYVFDAITLSRLLENSGFIIDKIQCLMGSYPTFLLSLQFWMVENQMKQINQSRIIKLFSHPVSRIAFAPFFYFDNLGLRGPLLTVASTKGGE